MEPERAIPAVGLILLLMLMGRGNFKNPQSPLRYSPDFRVAAPGGSLLDISSNSTDRPTTDTAYTVTTEDKAAFQQLLTEIQSAWSAQDIAALRRLLTPEMLSYFSTALAEDNSRGVQNHVDGVELLKGDVREAWPKARRTMRPWTYAGALVTTVTTIPRGESGYLIEGSEETATESHEIWTFMRVRDGRWLLSAIQQ